jgi:hypothetical protein
MTNPSTLLKMDDLIETWEKDDDQRVIFLRCYEMMTRNMLKALSSSVFIDPDWVHIFLDNFAGFYFHALETYEQSPDTAPKVWRLAFDRALHDEPQVLKNLLLGVNAHINYDLVLTVTELLGKEWAGLSDNELKGRYKDYCLVNDVIGQTIDAVQNDIIDPAMPVMKLIDALLASYDEKLISHLISHWRENTWHQALKLLETSDPEDREELLEDVEREAMRWGDAILIT